VIAEAPVMPRNKPKRNDENVKIDAEVVSMARELVSASKQTMAELLSETLRPILKKKLEQHYRDRLKKLQD
jgi:hypothetical protein